MNLYYLESSISFRARVSSNSFSQILGSWMIATGIAVPKIRRFIYIYIYVCIPGFNGTWKQLECRHVRRFACKEERAKCNLDYHSNEDLCTASAYASGCDSLENCLRCWYWKFMRITSTGDAEVTARARASPRPKPFVADENYTLETAWPLLSMTPPLNIYIYIYFSLVLYRFFSIGEKKISFSSRMSKNVRKKEQVSLVCIHSYDFFTLFSIQHLFTLAIMSLYCLLQCFT